MTALPGAWSLLFETETPARSIFRVIVTTRCDGQDYELVEFRQAGQSSVMRRDLLVDKQRIPQYNNRENSR